ncbi:hypothetical protein MPSEU_000014700 [Mayamaea pseudoterrestris]|nr:hypothetical protein MPSEU_000014700 [Mayamaea pseudoterrestris]
MPRAPSLVQHFRQVIGRAFRETGQALDRLGLRTAQLAATKHDYYDDPCLFDDNLSRHRQLMPLLYSGKPIVHPHVAYLAPCATLIGSVHIASGCSVWYGAVLRADECLNAEVYSENHQAISDGSELVEAQEDGECQIKEPWKLNAKDSDHHHGGAIFIGANTNVQDGCVITSRIDHTVIGEGVTIGHLAQIHSAKIDDFCLIGMGSVIGEGAHVQAECLIGAGAVIQPKQVVASGELWVGNPARKLRDLSAKERQRLHYQSSEYVGVATHQRSVMALGGNIGEEQATSLPELAAPLHDEPLKVQSGQ